MGSGREVAPLCTCATCANFASAPTAELPDIGWCGVELPPWVEPLLRPGERHRTVLVEQTCGLHRPRELAQCEGCRFQRGRGGLIIGCNAPELGGFATMVLFRLARFEPCEYREPLEYGPNAYRSLDLPREASR